MQGIEANLAQQRALYGEPLGETAARIMGSLGLTQARLAHVLQISPPMMSQLISAQRVKIGNPAVVHRLRSLSELASRAVSMSAQDVASRLEVIRDEQVTMTGQLAAPVATGTAGEALRAVADPAELRILAAAAEQLPNLRLAGLLRSAADQA